VEWKITYFTGIRGVMIREAAQEFGIITEELLKKLRPVN